MLTIPVSPHLTAIDSTSSHSLYLRLLASTVAAVSEPAKVMPTFSHMAETGDLEPLVHSAIVALLAKAAACPPPYDALTTRLVRLVTQLSGECKVWSAVYTRALSCPQL